jgi:hypothetical protein
MPSTSLEFWKAVFEYGGVLLLFFTFIFGGGLVITTTRLNHIQADELREFNRKLTEAQTGLAEQQERAATAERKLLELQERIKPRHLTDKEAAAFVSV